MRIDQRIFLKQRNYLFIFLGFSVLVSLLLTQRIEEFHVYASILLVPFFYLSLIFYLSFYNSKFFILNLLSITFFIKVLFVFGMAMVLEERNDMPFLSYNDDYVYNEVAREILETWRARGFGFYQDVTFSTGFYSGYPNFSAASMWLFGENIFAPRIMNCFFSTATVWFFYKTLKLVEKEVFLVRAITTIFAFSLTYVFYASFQLKDSILLFFLGVIVYYVSLFLKKGISLNIIIALVVSCLCMLFFRAAVLFAVLISLVLTVAITKSSKRFSFFNYLALLIVIFGFLYGWDQLKTLDLLIYDSEEYFASRLAVRGTEDALTGSTDLSNLGYIQVLLGPLYMLFSFFLPTPLSVQLTDGSEIFNYHFVPLIQVYSILPLSILGIVYVIKYRNFNKIGFFILSFVILYKLGQASSKSIFDSRQSLPALYGMNFMTIFYFRNRLLKNRNKNRIIFFSVIIMMIVLFLFSFVRLFIRGSI